MKFITFEPDDWSVSRRTINIETISYYHGVPGKKDTHINLKNGSTISVKMEIKDFEKDLIRVIDPSYIFKEKEITKEESLR